MIQKILLPAIILALVLTPWAGLQQAEYSKQDVEKLLRHIDTILLAEKITASAPLREIEVTENELNSFIAYSLQDEKVMTELELKLLDKNRLEGRIFIDLKGQKLPPLLRPEMNFFFSGELETKDGLGRLNLSKLFLEGQSIQPRLIDMVIYLASKINNTETSSINDWFELPYGIKEVKLSQEKARFCY